MQHFTHDGYDFAFIDEGEGDPVLLIHGFGSSHSVNWVTPGWVQALNQAGYRAIALDNPEQGILIVVYAAFVGHIAEAVIIDIDNWRHFYLLVGTLWGAILAVEERGGARQRLLRMPFRPARQSFSAASGFQA